MIKYKIVVFDEVRILFHFNIKQNAVFSTQNATGASLDSDDAEETNARNCNIIREGKRKLEGNTRIWDNNNKMDPKGTIFYT